jgi:hypothetical protein
MVVVIIVFGAVGEADFVPDGGNEEATDVEDASILGYYLHILIILGREDRGS